MSSPPSIYLCCRCLRRDSGAANFVGNRNGAVSGKILFSQQCVLPPFEAAEIGRALRRCRPRSTDGSDTRARRPTTGHAPGQSALSRRKYNGNTTDKIGTKAANPARCSAGKNESPPTRRARVATKVATKAAKRAARFRVLFPLFLPTRENWAGARWLSEFCSLRI